VLGIVWNAPHVGGTAAGVGVIVYVALRLFRGILDPLIIWLLTRNADA
jgi:hypothetical protein